MQHTYGDANGWLHPNLNIDFEERNTWIPCIVAISFALFHSPSTHRIIIIPNACTISISLKN